MAKTPISAYLPRFYDGLHSADGKSFGLSAVEVLSTHAYDGNGGKKETVALLTVNMGSAKLTTKATFPCKGQFDPRGFPIGFYERQSDADKRILQSIYPTEMWVMQAARLAKNCDVSFIIDDSSDSVGIVMRVRGEAVYGKLRATDTDLLSWALSIGVGVIQQSDVDKKMDELRTAREEEDKAAKKAA